MITITNNTDFFSLETLEKGKYFKKLTTEYPKSRHKEWHLMELMSTAAFKEIKGG